MVKATSLIFSFLFLTFVESSSYSQAFQIGLSGGTLNFQNPELFTKSISRNGLDFKWGMKQGIKIGYVFKNMPLKLSGFFNYTRLKGKGTTNMVTPPWS